MNTTISSSSASPQYSSVSSLAQQWQGVRDETLALIAPLSAEDCQVQSMPDVSPAKWHLAHTTWFFETFVLEGYEPHFKPFDAQYRVLFNSYYNAVGDKHPRLARGLLTRPALAQVLAYRQQVDERMQDLLQSSHLHDESLLSLVTLGMHHEQQHQELILTDIKHVLSLSLQGAAYQQRWPLASVAPQPLQWVAHAGGVHELGHEGVGFAFDNEAPRHKVYLQPYELASRLVTHGEWADFIADGGYRRPELWLSLGWDWVQRTGAISPLYWLKHGTVSSPDWHTYTLQGMVAIDRHTPVCHINYFEADAFARWAAQCNEPRWARARLPTEAEWEHAAAAHEVKGNLRYAQAANALHPMPLSDAYAGHEQQLYGDVWEWTSSSYAAYPGYMPWRGAVGEYNGKFMCNQYVLRGGSCVTPALHVRASYRNFFPPEAQWQFSGLRLARDRC